MEGAYINIKLIIGNREFGNLGTDGTDSLFLISVNVWDISKLLIGNTESGTGNRELVPCSLFGYVIQCFKSAYQE